jgi:guanidinoacetate N-methyltransferase
MQRWETPLMRELADLVGTKGGRVLEVGFGMGIGFVVLNLTFEAISATFIQQYEQVTEHVIIEANAEVFKRLQQFAENSPRKVTPMFGFWQEVVTNLESESFDGILFDPYPVSFHTSIVLYDHLRDISIRRIRLQLLVYF